MASRKRRRQRGTIRGHHPFFRQKRQKEPRAVHVRRRFEERYGEPFTDWIKSQLIAKIRTREFIRDTWRPNLLQIKLGPKHYNLVWDPVVNKILTFYPPEDFRER